MNDRAVFTKAFTQQEPISEAAIARVSDILRTGRLHRYNTVGDERSEAALLEAEYAAYQGTDYCLAVTSGGQALQIALRAVGVRPGDLVLANAYTLAPVPGAMYATGAVPVFVDVDENWHINLDDLADKAERSGANYLMLSHMRGHIADMDRIVEICEVHGITMIEDCAHTMGATWKGKLSGNFGSVGCFSTQTYKHMNSGEGGLLTTSDPIIAARSVIMSGSYMLYGSHGAAPSEDVFAQVRLDAPNCSARLDNVRAAIIRDQLPNLDRTIAAWNERYVALDTGLRAIDGLRLPVRADFEHYVGSSIQFQVEKASKDQILGLIDACAARGVEIKWFGADQPKGFTSRYDSWQYLGEQPELVGTKSVLSTTCDMRVPLTFSLDDCELIVQIIGEEMAALQD